MSKELKRAVFVAGGTGGHINSALALGDYFEKKGYIVSYMSGNQELDQKLFESQNVRHFPSKALRGKSWFFRLRSLFLNALTFIGSFIQLFIYRPRFILGTGGYVCGPCLMAGFCLGIPIYVLEQNSVVGLTNKILARFSRKIFINFLRTKGLEGVAKNKLVHVGNPVRSDILMLQKREKGKQREAGKVHLLVFGGSLGSRDINKVVHELLDNSLCQSLKIKHQVGQQETEGEVSLAGYERIGYIDDMAAAYDWSDVVLCRAGASTLSELRYVGKPCILIPFPHHKDRHQFQNAESFREEVDFPVWIMTIEEISQNNMQVLKRVIEEVSKFEYKAASSGMMKKSASELVFEEMTQNV